MNTKLILLLTVLILGAGIMSFVLFSPGEGLLRGLPVFNFDDDNTGGNVGGGGGSTGGKSGGGSGGESGVSGVQGGQAGLLPGSECRNELFSYSSFNFGEGSECNLYENSKCVDKIVLCSANLINYEDFGGTFGVSFKFFEEGDPSIIHIDFSEQFIESHEMGFFEGRFDVQGEFADSDFFCLYTISAPLKEVCL